VTPRPRASLRSATTWLAGERLIALIVSALVWIVVARLLGPAEYGVLSYATASVAIVLPAVLALQPLLVQRLANAPGERSTFTAAVRLALVLSLVCLAVPVGFAVARSDDRYAAAAVIAASTALLFGCFTVGEASLIAAGRVRVVSVVRLIATFAGSAGRLVLAVASIGAVGLALVGSVQFALTALVLFSLAGGWTLLARATIRSECRASAEQRQELLAAAWPLSLAGLAVAVYMSIDLLMLGLLSSDAETGQYAVAVRMVEATYLVPMALMTAVSPVIARLKRDDDKRYHQRLQQLASLCLVSALAAGAVVAVASWPVIRLLAGPQYGDSFQLLLLLLPATIFVGLGVAQGPWIINEGRTRFQLARTASGAGVNVVLNLALIPVLGAAGAAIATVVSYAASAVLSNALYPPARSYLRVQLKAFDPRVLRAATTPGGWRFPVVEDTRANS
jgi:O-antigen/teichoic acid export membrane protein